MMKTHFVFLILILISPLFARATDLGIPLFTYEGILTDNSSPPAAITSTKDIRFQIIPASTPACVLYEEVQESVIPGSSGEFSVSVGTGTRTDTTGNTADLIFASTKTANCKGGGTFVAGGFADRVLKIAISDHNSDITLDVFTSMSGSVSLGNIPYALNAQRLNDKQDTDFIQVNNSKNVTKTKLEDFFSTFAFDKTTSSISTNISGNAATATHATSADSATTATTAATAGSVSGTVAIGNGGTGKTSAAEAINALLPTQASQTNKYLKTDGTNVSWATVSTGLTAVSNTASLANNKIWIGDSSGKAQEMAVSGDAGLAADGTLTLTSVGAVGNYYKVTTDAKGRVVSGSTTLASSDITTALGYTPVSAAGDTTMTGALGLFKTTSFAPGAGDTGKIWYDTGVGKVKYYDGTSVKIVGEASSGLTSLNGSTAAAQLFAIGTSGTAPGWDSTTTAGTHKLNIPMASTAGTTAGLVSNAELAAKMSTTLTSANIWVGNSSDVATAVAPGGDVTMTSAGNFTVNASKVKGISVSVAPTLTGQVLRYDGSSWTPNYVSLADIRSSVTGTTFTSAACSASQTLTWASATDSLVCSNIVVGGANFANQTTNVFLAGPSSGGDAAPAFRSIAAADLPTTLGPSASTALTLQTAGSARVTIDSAGKVGIGTASPSVPLEVSGNVKATNLIVTTPSTTQTTGSLLVGNGTSAVSAIAPGAVGNILKVNSSGAWESTTPAAASSNVVSGADASIPTAGTAGRLYVATDTLRIYMDTGSAWKLVAKRNAFAGYTTSTYTGATIGGYSGAASACSASGFSEARMCTTGEIATAFLAGVAGSPGNAWVSPIGTSYTDCSAWTSNSGSLYGSQFSSTLNSVSQVFCSSSFKIACCY